MKISGLHTHTKTYVYTNKQKNAYNSLRMRSTYKKQKYIYQSIFISPTIMKNSKVKEVDGLLHLLLFPLPGMKKGLIFFVE